MAALYYCSDLDLTDQLPDSLTDSPIATAAQRNIKLRGPAAAWINAMYPGAAPFAPIAAQTVDWLVDQASHAAGDTAVTIDGGTGDPAAGDQFRIEDQNTWYKISAYSSNVITFSSNPPYWNGAAYDDFPDDARIMLGTPALVRAAATHFAVGIGTLILRRQPEDKAATAAFELARELIGARDGGLASHEPWPWNPLADDAGQSPRVFQSGIAKLVR
jgi:hypothetical protein